MSEVPQIRSVWKFTIEDDPCILEMPHRARLVHAAMQHGRMQVWFEVDPSAAKVQRAFTVARTGDPILPAYQYRATVMDGPYVWHLYEAGDGS